MRRVSNSLGRGLFAVVALFVMVGCQKNHDSVDSSGGDGPARIASDSLDRATAESRKQRLSAVAYDVFIDLLTDPESFSGSLNVRFDLANGDDDLTIDFGGGDLRSVVVNGQATEVAYNDFFLRIPGDVLRTGANQINIEFAHDYSQDGTGLHRFLDPADGKTYLYSYLWPYYANRLFPLFDQPNIKAELTLKVRAPSEWVVVSTSDGSATEHDDISKMWQFATTPKMSSYVFSLHAGPYRIWEDDAAGIPIRLMARESMAEYVAVDEWLAVTKRGLTYYGDYFDIAYPFSKYDQLIVPDFNIGAMENIAAVTFAERYVQRQQSDRSEREARASVILHEMAHMWFGNLVTHEWWNGLWLNESFATQMAAMAEKETTEFDDTWHGFLINAKRRAYQRDRLVTTHPIEVPIKSTAEFFSVFDAITYQKGSSVLKQLAHYVGEENYRRGVSEYLKKYSYSTTNLADFIASQAASSATDLTGWSDEWLFKAGFNTLRAEPICDGNTLKSLSILQTANADQPFLRNHQLEVALYYIADDGRVLPADVIVVTVSGAVTDVPLADRAICPAMINPNHDDWAYARVDLDSRTVEFLDEYLAKIPEPMARSVFLEALADRALAGEESIAEFVSTAIRLAESEPNIRVQQQVSGLIVQSIQLMQRLQPDTSSVLKLLTLRIEQQAMQHISRADDPDVKRNWFNTFAGTLSSEAGLGAIRALLDGEAEIPGLDISADIRWILLQILARNGADDIDQLIRSELAASGTDFAAKNALTAHAARPDEKIKSDWIGELRNPSELSGLANQRAVMSGLFPANQTALQLELFDSVLSAIPPLSESSDPYFMSSYVSDLLQPVCRQESVSKLEKFLDDYRSELTSTALRFVREAHQRDVECLRLRDLQ